jgi:Na+/H+ antiporter NhaD/arsenite permease-like protein
MPAGMGVALLIFLGLYVFLTTEWLNRALATLVAALLVMGLHLISPAGAIRRLDWNTLALLLGLMLLVNLLEHAGLFRLVAHRVREAAGGSAWGAALLFLVVTAGLSAFLPNLTVILIFGPAIMSLAEDLELPVIPLLIMAVLVSNLGGLGTLIGDPPNILIGTEAAIGFGGFVAYAGPLAVILIVVALAYARLTVPVPPAAAGRHAAGGGVPVASSPHLKPLLAVFLLTLAAFGLSGPLGLPLGLIGLGGGLLAALVTGHDFDQVLSEVDWSTMVFFAGLFVVVGALEAQGVTHAAADWLLGLPAGPLLPVGLMTGVAILSAFIDNVPIVAAAIPLVRIILEHHPGYGTDLWFALAIGAAVGGNATLVGASANVVAAGLAKARGYSLSFKEFLRWGAPLAVMTWAVAALYLWLWPWGAH